MAGTHRDKMIRLGLLSGKTSVAEASPFSDENQDRVLAMFKHPAAFSRALRCQALLEDVDQFVMYEPTSRKVMPVMHIRIAEINNDARHVANMSDTVGEMMGVLLPEGWSKHFLGLAANDVATNFAMPMCTNAAVDEIPPRDAGADVQGTRARLDFVADHPRLVAWPVMFPMPRGVTIGSEGLSLSDPLPEDLKNKCPLLEVWTIAVAHIVKNNAAKSLHCGDFLDPTQFEQDGTCAAVELVEDPFEPVTMIPIGTPAHSTLREKVTKEIRDEILARYGQQQAVADGADAPVAAAPGGNAVLEIGPQTLAALQGSTRLTKKEQDQEKNAEDMIRRTSIAFAKCVTADDGTQRVVVPVLTDEYQEFLKCSRTEQAMRLLAEMVGSGFTTAEKSDSRLDAGVTFDSKMINLAFSQADRNHGWASGPPRRNLSHWKTALSLIQFLPPVSNTVEYKKIESEHADTLTREFVSDGGTKDHTSGLFMDGDITTVDCTRKALLNYRVFSKAKCVDFDDSILWQELKEIESVLHSAAGRAFSEEFALASTCGVAVNVFLMVADLIRMAHEIGNSPTYYKLVKDGKPIPLAAFNQLKSNSKAIQMRIMQAVTMGNPVELNVVPSAIALFPRFAALSSTPAPAATAATASSTGKRASTDTKAAKKAAKTTTSTTASGGSPAETSTAKDKGFLKFTGAKGIKLPICPVTGDNGERGCNFWMFEKFECKFGEKCVRHHWKGFGDIPKAKQDEFKNWVEKSPDVEFVRPPSKK